MLPIISNDPNILGYDDNGDPMYANEPEGEILIQKSIKTINCPRCETPIKYEFELTIDMNENSVYTKITCPECDLIFKIKYPHKIKY